VLQKSLDEVTKDKDTIAKELEREKKVSFPTLISPTAQASMCALTTQPTTRFVFACTGSR
jgi:hypothetical protein